MLCIPRRCRHCRLPPRRIEFPPPLILIALTPVRLAVLGVEMLGEALAPLHRLAEPELLLVSGQGRWGACIRCRRRLSASRSPCSPIFPARDDFPCPSS